MSNVIKLADSKRLRAHAREQASVYLARLDAGASSDECREIEIWLAQSPLHREIFLDSAALWDDMSVLSGLSEVFPLQEYQPRKAQAWGTRSWVVAASVFLLMLVSGVWFLQDEFSGDAHYAAAEEGVYQQHVTEIGQQSTVVLPDGSEIILNTNTELEVAFFASARNIFLKQGQAYFSVTKDPARPFRVYAGKRMVEAVGTSFTVQRTEPDSVEVVVEEGKVNFLRLSASMEAHTLPFNVDSVLHRDENVALVAGELAAAVTDQTNAVEKKLIKTEEIEAKLAWTDGMLLFHGDSLEHVLQEVSRYTTTRIEAVDTIREIQVQGYFRAGDIDGLLVAMKRNFSIEAQEVAPGHILLYAGQ